MNSFFDKKEFGRWFFALRRANGYSHIRDFCRDVEQRTGVWLNPEIMRKVEEGESRISLEAFLASMPVLISDDEDTALLTIVTELSGFIEWDVMPNPGKCPICNEPMLLEKTDEGTWHLHCSNADCLLADGREYRTREEAIAANVTSDRSKPITKKKTIESVDVSSLPKFVDVLEMAKFAQLSTQRIHQLIKTGKIPASKRGGKLKASREDFADFLVKDGRVK